MYSFDEYFTDYCSSRNWKYSRYADDIYISSQEYLPCSLRSEVNEKLKEIGFSSNNNKTWFCSKKCRREITGLILTENGRVSVGLKKRLADVYKRQDLTRLSHDPAILMKILEFLQDHNAVLITTESDLKYELYIKGLEKHFLRRAAQKGPRLPW